MIGSVLQTGADRPLSVMPTLSTSSLIGVAPSLVGTTHTARGEDLGDLAQIVAHSKDV